MDGLYSPLGFWLLLLGGGALLFDLLVHRRAREIGIAEAAGWSLFYAIIAALYGGLVYFHAGPEMAMLYATGYVLEKALSVDNLFVFGAVFAAFSIAPRYQHRILHIGILGAVILRLVFVMLGAGFLHTAEGWAMLVFAAVLGCVTWKMGSGDAGPVTESWYYRAAHRVWPIDAEASPSSFFKGGLATLALPALVAVELADVMFAFDSVPAVIAVSREPIIIWSAMVMAILGLRALYFVLEALKRALHMLERAVVLILGFICAKLLLHAGWSLIPDTMETMNRALINGVGTRWLDLKIEPHESLAVIGLLLAGATVLSLALRPAEAHPADRGLTGSRAAPG